MKKLMIISLSLLATLCACTKQELTSADNNKTGRKQTVIAHVTCDTKLTFTDNGIGAGFSSVWDKFDTFQAIQDGSTIVEFRLVSGAGTSVGTFVCDDAEGVTESTQWTAVLGSGSNKTNEIHGNYLNQDGKLSSLKKYLYMSATGTGEEPSFNFTDADKYSYVFRVKVPAGTKCIEYTPCAYNKIKASGCEIVNYNSGEQDDYISSDRMSTITLSAAASAGDLVYIAVPLLDCSNTHNLTNSNKQHQNLVAGIVMTFLNDASDDATASNGIVINNDLRGKGGKIATVDCSAMALMSRPRPADAVEFKTYNVDADYHSASYQRAKTVDTFWAPYNIGATTASDAGKFLMFGDWAQKDLSQNPSLPAEGSTQPGANQYPYWTTATGGYMSMGHLHSKLIDNANNTTFYSIQSSKYDAARVLWGSAWRMPHCVELWALGFNDGNVKSVNGSVIRFSNTKTGNYIDVPVAGCYKNGSHNDTAYAVLWSADKNQRSHSNPGWNAAYAMCIKNNLGDNKIDRYEMCNAIPIRPVLVSSLVNDNPAPYDGPANSGVAPGWEEITF